MIFAAVDLKTVLMDLYPNGFFVGLYFNLASSNKAANPAACGAAAEVPKKLL